MSLLSDLNTVLDSFDIPVETGVFSDVPPDEYLVITPTSDNFDYYADDLPRAEMQEARLSLFSKGNYLAREKEIVLSLILSDFLITDRRYLGYEEDTGFHHFAIDVAKVYEVEF